MPHSRAIIPHFNPLLIEGDKIEKGLELFGFGVSEFHGATIFEFGAKVKRNICPYLKSRVN